MGHQEQFSTDTSSILASKTVNVTSLNVFDSIRVGNIITLVGDIGYNITNGFSWEDVEFVLDPTARITFMTTNTVANGINTEILPGRTLFSGELSRVAFEGVDLVSANGGKCFDLTDAPNVFPLLVIEKCRIQGFDAVGNLNQVSLATENIGYVLNGDGWDIVDASILQISEQNFILSEGIGYKISGTTGSIFCDTIEVAPTTTDVVFDVSGTIGGAFFDVTKVKPISGGSIFNIDSATTAQTFQINTGLLDDSAGGTMFKAGGLDQTSPFITVSRVANVLDSYWVGSTGFTGGTTETVFADTSTWVKIAGTYIDGYTERASHADGVSTYEGKEAIYTDLVGSAKVLMKPDIETDIIQVALFKNDAEVANSRVQHTLGAVFQTPTSPDFNPKENVLLEEDDTYELRARNISNPTNVIFTDAKTKQRR